jgi:hypothetical protein
VPHRPTWQIHYIVYYVNSMSDKRRVDLQLNIDAVTGDVLTAMEVSGNKQRIIFDRHGGFAD